MSYSFTIEPSTRKNKKLKVVINKDGFAVETIHFGDNRYSDYIEYYRSNPAIANQRRLLYLSRHNKEDWNNFLKPAFWSRWVLWEKKTLKEAIDNIDLNR